MDNAIIYDYFKLGQRIERAKQRYTYYDWLFWQQSFTGGYAYDENGNKLGAKPFQILVEDLISYEDLNDTVVDLLTFKRRAFEQYLNGLNQLARDYLTAKFSQHIPTLADESIEADAISECNQIEEASGYRFGFVTDKAVELTKDYNANLENILSMLG